MPTTTTAPPPTPQKAMIKVGIILITEPIQLLDVAPIDILGMMEPSYLRALGLPETFCAKGIDFEYHYVNETGKGPNQMSAGFKLAVTDSIHTCPPLSILLVGGAPPTHRPSEAMLSFLRTQYEHCSAYLSVCTGYHPTLLAGLFKGNKATAPRGLLPHLQARHPEVQWVSKRWVRDGKVWSSGAVMNGFDMIQAYMLETFPRDVVGVALRAADLSGRGAEY